MITVLMQGFHGSLTPLIISNYQKVETPYKIAQLFRYFVFGALIAFLSISLFAREIIILLTTPEYYSAYVLVPMLLLDKIFYAIYIFAPGLNIAKKTKIVAYITVSAASINIVMSFIGIKLFGLLGAAFGTMFSSIFMFSSQMYLSQKYYYVPHNFIKISICFFFIILLVLFNYVFLENLQINFGYKILIDLGIIMIGVISCLKVGIISKNEIYSAINTFNKFNT